VRQCAFIVLGVLLAACSGAREEVAQSITGGWTGQPFDSFVTKHGPPQSQHKLTDGRTVAEWSDTFGIASTKNSLLTAASGAQHQGGALQLNCRLRFTVSRSGTIEQMQVVNDTFGRFETSRCAEVLRR
jgi:hypothetical protein